MLKTLKLENFTCFPKADLTFSKGLNVIIGENGTGKSHLLKMGYALLQTMYEFKEKQHEKQIIKLKFSQKVTEHEINKTVNEKIQHEFLSHLEKTFNASIFSSLSNNTSSRMGFFISSDFGESGAFAIDLSIEIRLDYDADVTIDVMDFNFTQLSHSPVFFPPKEILSVYNGFRSTLKKRELGFDKTYLDFAECLDVALLTEVENKNIQNCISILEDSINNHTVEYDSKSFYFVKKEDKVTSSEIKIPAHLFAEGHNKLGTLSYLMRNGSIQEGMTLFWDEPEANMNPRLLRILAQILVEMSAHMQVIISTHSLFLLKELDILSREKDMNYPIQFTGLHLQENQTVTLVQSEKLTDIGDIAALDASLEQSDRFMQSRRSS